MISITSFSDLIPLLIKIIVASIIMMFVTLFANKISTLIQEVCNRNQIDTHTSRIMSKIFRYIILILGAATALQNIGVEVATGIFTLFGVTGIVLSYGMKDIVANFIASVLIIGYKQIKIDDYIEINHLQGRVVDINFRYTTLHYENKTILIPNIVIYTTAVAIKNR